MPICSRLLAHRTSKQHPLVRIISLRDWALSDGVQGPAGGEELAHVFCLVHHIVGEALR